MKQFRLWVLRMFEVIERPAAWLLLIGAIITFAGVLIGWITVGDFKWPTLLIAADLMVSGFSAVQEANEDDACLDDERDMYYPESHDVSGDSSSRGR